MALDRKAAIGKVAEHYGILLGEDYPLWASVFLYELALEDHLGRMEEAASVSAHEIMMAVRAELAGARGAAPAAITAASAALVGDFRKESKKVLVLVQRAVLASLLCLAGSVLMFAGTVVLWLWK